MESRCSGDMVLCCIGLAMYPWWHGLFETKQHSKCAINILRSTIRLLLMTGQIVNCRSITALYGDVRCVCVPATTGTNGSSDSSRIALNMQHSGTNIDLSQKNQAISI